MSTVTDKQYKDAAKEFNDVFGLNPKINVNKDMDYIKEKLVKALVLIDPKDKFTPGTTAVIKELKAATAAPAAKKATPAAKAAPAPEVEVEVGETVENTEETTDEDPLVAEINAADTLKELKEIASANEEYFGEMKLTAFKNAEGLKAAMLQIYADKTAPAIEAEETDPEPEETQEDVPVVKAAPGRALGKGVAPAAKKETEKPVPAKAAAAAPKAPAEKKAAPAPAAKKDAYTRIDAVADALKKAKKPFATIKEWIEAGDAEYAENGGKSNIAESTMMTKYALKVLRKFGVAVPTE